MSNRPVSSVVRFSGEGNCLKIVDPRFLECYTRKWNEDSSLWPPQCTLLGDDGDDRECTLLFIGSREECEAFERKHTINGKDKACNCDQEFDVLKEELVSLQSKLVHIKNKQMISIREQFAEAKKQSEEMVKKCSKSKTISVSEDDFVVFGTSKQKLSKSMCKACLGHGANLKGFLLFSKSIFGREFFVGKTWTILPIDVQAKIKDQLEFFILSSLEGQPRSKDKVDKLLQSILRALMIHLNREQLKTKPQKDKQPKRKRVARQPREATKRNTSQASSSPSNSDDNDDHEEDFDDDDDDEGSVHNFSRSTENGSERSESSMSLF